MAGPYFFKGAGKAAGSTTHGTLGRFGVVSPSTRASTALAPLPQTVQRVGLLNNQEESLVPPKSLPRCVDCLDHEMSTRRHGSEQPAFSEVRGSSLSPPPFGALLLRFFHFLFFLNQIGAQIYSATVYTNQGESRLTSGNLALVFGASPDSLATGRQVPADLAALDLAPVEAAPLEVTEESNFPPVVPLESDVRPSCGLQQSPVTTCGPAPALTSK